MWPSSPRTDVAFFTSHAHAHLNARTHTHACMHLSIYAYTHACMHTLQGCPQRYQWAGGPGVDKVQAPTPPALRAGRGS